MRTLDTIFGSGNTGLDALQMSMRALVVFFVTLVLVRVGGMRAFGRNASFDTIIVIMLGAVLSRTIVGASDFAPTVAASLVLVVVHRVLAIATARFPTLERLVKGEHRPMYQDGELDRTAMLRAGISAADLDEAVRRQCHRTGLRDVERVELESSGQLSVVERS